MRSENGHSGDRRPVRPLYHGAAVKHLKRGQGYAEYGLILMLIGLVVIGALTILGQQVHDLWHNITSAMPH
jgi:pilus assembly protein Flp/PilA